MLTCEWICAADAGCIFGDFLGHADGERRGHAPKVAQNRCAADAGADMRGGRRVDVCGGVQEVPPRRQKAAKRP